MNLTTLSQIPLIGNLFFLPEVLQTRPSIIFYDNDCGLCSKTVEFLLRSGRSKNLEFAPLFGETYNGLIKHPDRYKDMDSILLYDKSDGSIHSRSRAVFLAMSHCRWWVRWMTIFILIPRELSDMGYQIIASMRKKVFGNRCMVLSEQEKALFKK